VKLSRSLAIALVFIDRDELALIIANRTKTTLQIMTTGKIQRLFAIDHKGKSGFRTGKSVVFHDLIDMTDFGARSTQELLPGRSSAK